MARDLNEAWGWIEKLVRRVARLESGAQLEKSSITNGRMRFIGGQLLIDSGGSLRVVGTADVAGTQRVTGRLEGSGSFNWTGPSWLRGGSTIEGTLRVTETAQLVGNTTIGGTCTIGASLAVNGQATLNSDLTIGRGRIRAGAVTITPSGGGAVQVGTLQIDGANGGTIRSSGTIYLEGDGPSVRVVGQLSASSILAFGKIIAAELDVMGAKNFRMPHPTKPGHWLRHGSTESPVSGIEYWGDITLDDSGTCRVELPEYFEALAKPDGRWVSVTGRGFAADWTDIDAGAFTVTGPPGGRASWLVKAERFGGDFLLEEEIPADAETAPPADGVHESAPGRR